jgi:hypothetical protein
MNDTNPHKGLAAKNEKILGSKCPFMKQRSAKGEA